MTHQVSAYLLEDQISYRTEVQTFFDSLTLPNDNFQLNLTIIKNFIAFYEQVESFEIQDNDIFLIDIDLQIAYSGIDFAIKIRENNANCFIVFLTNFDDKGIEVINLNINATSYILKGDIIDHTRLKQLFGSIQSKIYTRTHDEEGYISFKKAGETIYIKYEDILYIQSVYGVRNTLLIKTISSEQIVDGSINQLKKKIRAKYLYTELKSLIINLSKIYSLNYLLELIVFVDGSELAVGKKIVYKLKKKL